jgi:hypothetical protein
METQSDKPVADGAAQAEERRAAVRYPCDLHTTCQPMGRTAAGSWPARAVNISANGIALVLNRRFERGTILSIGLESADGQTARSMLVRVVYAKGQDDGSWRMGCVFASELGDEELQAFKAKRLRPTEPDFRAWVRFPCNVETVCWEAVPGNEENFAVRVLEVSPAGMSLLAPRQFAQGTLLNVELPTVVGGYRRHVLVRVINNRPSNIDEWILGCELADRISDEELRRFQ